MTVCVELLSALRQQAGVETLTVQVSAAGKPSVLLALQALEALPRAQALGLLEGAALRKGVLAFVRTPGGTLHRVFHPDAQSLAEGQALVLATAVEGG